MATRPTATNPTATPTRQVALPPWRVLGWGWRGKTATWRGVANPPRHLQPPSPQSLNGNLAAWRDRASGGRPLGNYIVTVKPHHTYGTQRLCRRREARPPRPRTARGQRTAPRPLRPLRSGRACPVA